MAPRPWPCLCLGGSLDTLTTRVSFGRAGSSSLPTLCPVWRAGAETISFSPVPPTFGKNIWLIKNEMGLGWETGSENPRISPMGEASLALLASNWCLWGHQWNCHCLLVCLSRLQGTQRDPIQDTRPEPDLLRWQACFPFPSSHTSASRTHEGACMPIKSHPRGPGNSDPGEWRPRPTKQEAGLSRLSTATQKCGQSGMEGKQCLDSLRQGDRAKTPATGSPRRAPRSGARCRSLGPQTPWRKSSQLLHWEVCLQKKDSRKQRNNDVALRQK